MNDRIEIAKEFAKTIKSDDIKLIMLFGSVARGEDTEESDIDILIVSPNADDLRYKINRIAVDIILEKDEVISPHLMTEEHFNKTRNNPFLTNVLNEGVVIG
ncbi:MAG: nucleotidyltransferase domain-containing protein [Methanobrevibacter sp.]|uniref:nucleotidyltransferase domain-containing protein n=1 Tax=uncultured Methanobrevibacter sp. TaxID=253161 RepID=UPI0025DA8D2B|nr:nucleotidyltransferase domain-containing protein [uncultured Methanobrevibacter sp.]MBQ6629122.1 nucleotidyltransferase domain-containing protein [Methanobrevibacter sp.]MEE3489339.1 nucleotidyltransferase domain-containing protein [Methanobrevibacter sp.]